MLIGYRLNQLIKNGTITEAKPIVNNMYVEGQYYWCSYWSKFYKVIKAEYEKHGTHQHLKNVTVQWEDGTTGIHCTSLDMKRDYLLTMA